MSKWSPVAKRCMSCFGSLLVFEFAVTHSRGMMKVIADGLRSTEKTVLDTLPKINEPALSVISTCYLAGGTKSVITRTNGCTVDWL